MNGFEVGETGYCLTEDGWYYYTRCQDTESMQGLFKSKREAILNAIQEAKEYVLELEEMLEEN